MSKLPGKDPNSPKNLEKNKGTQKDEPIILIDLENPEVTETIGLGMSSQKQSPSQLLSVGLGLRPEDTPEGYLCEGVGPSCQWIDTGEMKNRRQQLAQSNSGFEVCKRKKQEEEFFELDFGDAIRYFARMNPVRFQQLMQEELDCQLDAEQHEYAGKESKKLKKKMEIENRKIEKAQRKAEKKGEKVNETTMTGDPMTCKFFDELESSYRQPKQGLKIKIAAKNRPAFTRLDCR